MTKKMTKFLCQKTEWDGNRNIKLYFPPPVSCAELKCDDALAVTRLDESQSNEVKDNSEGVEYRNSLHEMTEQSHHVPRHASAVSVQQPFNWQGKNAYLSDIDNLKCMPKIVNTKTVWVNDKNVRIKFPKAIAWTKEDGTECATNYIRFQSDRSETNYDAAQHSRDICGMGQRNDHVPLHASALSLNHPNNKLGDGPKLSVQLGSPYDVNYGTPYKTGGLDRDMQFYNQANGPNKEVFNKHYSSLGRGTFVTTKEKFELMCKKTYDPVSDKTKYVLIYHVQNNVISSLY